MRGGIRESTLAGMALAGCLWAGTARSAAAQQGSITWQVVDDLSGAPVEAARVILTGTSHIETTDREGRTVSQGRELRQ